jgi:hypothetical protein
MSHRTVMNRWRRYQRARLEALLEGLLREARRMPGNNHERRVRELGEAMFVALDDYCDRVAVTVDHGVSQGAPFAMPDLAFERL